MHLISGIFSDFFLPFLHFVFVPRGSIAWKSDTVLTVHFVTINFNNVFLDPLGREHSASGGENLRLSRLHEVAGKQTRFIPIREY
jgi:hypothetical protein